MRNFIKNKSHLYYFIFKKRENPYSLGFGLTILQIYIYTNLG
jgi:hypothetical protein